ncbi:MAG: hypothetical protein IJ716_05275 [Lachnospiraceae bacterium]|nr:hypothetical protein [Lachnospiraceae bacterium]MBR1854974.1 hypothetical protein [Lachnospiraceae bacterium]
MNSREVKRTLRSMPARTRQEPMEKTIAALHTYFQKTPPTHRISFMGTAVRFVRFTAWKIWLFQGLVMVFISQFLLGFQDRQMAWTMGTSVKILCLFCGTIPFILFPFLYRSLRYQMQEVEMAAHFSYAKQMLVKLCVVEAGNVCMLAGGIVISVVVMQLQTLTALTYGMLSFLLLTTVLMLAIAHLALYKAMAVCGGSYVLFFAVLEQCVFGSSQVISAPVGMAATLICIFLCCVSFFQVRKILQSASYQELHLLES